MPILDWPRKYFSVRYFVNFLANPISTFTCSTPIFLFHNPLTSHHGEHEHKLPDSMPACLEWSYYWTFNLDTFFFFAFSCPHFYPSASCSSFRTQLQHLFLIKALFIEHLLYAPYHIMVSTMYTWSDLVHTLTPWAGHYTQIQKFDDWCRPPSSQWQNGSPLSISFLASTLFIFSLLWDLILSYIKLCSQSLVSSRDH